MKTKADVETFLLRAELPFEEVADGMWVIRGQEGVQQIIIKFAPPVLVCRVRVMDTPRQKREECFRMLLELNVDEMVHGAYGLEGEKIVISAALELENLDFNELQATIDDITLAVADHHSRLAPFHEADAA
jgi:hypothetical protein